MKRKICIYIAFFCCLIPSAWAYQPKNVPQTNGYVSNPDGILSPEAVAQISQISEQLYQQTEAEMAVVAIRDIEGYDIADFGQQLFVSWGIGSKERNTGILILLATDSRDIRIHTGGGVEGLLPDALCSDIITNAMVPYLSEDQWDEGMLSGAAAVSRVLSSDEAKAELLLGYTPASHDFSDIVCYYLMLAFVILILLTVLLYNDMRPRACEDNQQRMRRQGGTWQLILAATIFFPLPLLFLLRWFYRHGGREIKAMLDAEAKKRREEWEEQNKNNGGFPGGGIYIGGPGFGGSHRGGGFSSGGFRGFGGGTSFGGGASGKF